MAAEGHSDPLLPLADRQSAMTVDEIEESLGEIMQSGMLQEFIDNPDTVNDHLFRKSSQVDLVTYVGEESPTELPQTAQEADDSVGSMEVDIDTRPAKEAPPPSEEKEALFESLLSLLPGDAGCPMQQPPASSEASDHAASTVAAGHCSSVSCSPTPTDGVRQLIQPTVARFDAISLALQSDVEEQQKQQQQRRRGSRQDSSKSYEAMCKAHNLMDAAARQKYSLDCRLGRDLLFGDIVQYIKSEVGTERDRVHRFLIVMLVDGALRIGPYGAFFYEAVYFCDPDKQRIVGSPSPLFHIKESIYVGVLWGLYKGNSCCDYATLGDAIKSVKSKHNGDEYFEDPDFGESSSPRRRSGKPKRLFKFGSVAYDEVMKSFQRRQRDRLTT